MTGVTGVARLEAAVDVIATFVEDQPPGRQLDLEPGFGVPANGPGAADDHRRAGGCPAPVRARGWLRCRDGRPGLAGAIARTALSHYIFPDSDPLAARRQIRAAAGFARGRLV